MKKVTLIATIIMVIFIGSCKENETSFFIEHAKMQPTPPECTSAVSDPEVHRGLLDVSMGFSYDNFFLLRNQLMAREDYDNLRAESNGVFIDASLVSIRSSDNRSLGSTQGSADDYMDPETEDIIFAEIISSDIGRQIAQEHNCLDLTPLNYPQNTLGVDRTGRLAGRYLDTVQALVRFKGHTNGGVEVETPDFIFSITVCCGCLVNWTACQSECNKFCSEPDLSTGMCQLGIGTSDALVDCRNIYYDPNAIWDCEVRDEETNEVISIRECTCADC